MEIVYELRKGSRLASVEVLWACVGLNDRALCLSGETHTK